MRFMNKTIGTVAYMGGVPSVYSDFCWSMIQLAQFVTEQCRPGESVHFDRTGLSLHSAARNDLVKRMRGDWLLMLDTDHAPEPDLVWRMIDRMDTLKIDVLTGLYQYKSAPYSPVLYLANEEFFAPVGKWRAEGGDLSIFQVAAAGGGCLMVRKSVFDRIEAELKEEPFSIIHPFGEDMSFFKRLQKLKIPVYVDARIECPHLVTRAVTLDDYDREAVTFSEEKQVSGFVIGAA